MQPTSPSSGRRRVQTVAARSGVPLCAAESVRPEMWPRSDRVCRQARDSGTATHWRKRSPGSKPRPAAARVQGSRDPDPAPASGTGYSREAGLTAADRETSRSTCRTESGPAPCTQP